MSEIFYLTSTLWNTVSSFHLVFRDYALLTSWILPTLVYYKYLNRKTRKAWAETARILGFQMRDRWQTFALEGVHQKAPFLITAERRKSLESWIIRVHRPGPDRVRFTVRARSLKAPVQMGTAGRLIPTGDDPFDEAVRIQSEDETAVAAVFSTDVRRRMRLLVDGTSNAVGPEGMEFFESETAVTKEPAKIARLLQEAMDLLAVLQINDSQLVARLAANVEHDPAVAVRLNNISLLQKRFPMGEHVAAAMRTALNDSDPLIRLRAALYMKEKDLNKRIDDIVTAQSRPYAPGVLADVIDLLTVRVGPAAERALLHWLSAEASPVKLKAIEGLGKIGTPAVVGRLRALEAGILGNSEVKAAARKSIEKIQSRVDPSARGSLSLSEVQGSEGGLTLAHEGGELSLEPNEPLLPPKSAQDGKASGS